MIGKLIAGIVANGIGLYLVGRYVVGASIPFTFQGLVVAALILTLINFLIAPVLKFILHPLIILTFGLLGLVINGFTIYILTRILPSVSFDGLGPLAYATIILTLVNLAVHLI
jgi:putative membrane protein